MDKNMLRTLIEKQLSDAGVDTVGYCSAKPFNELEVMYNERMSKEYACEFERREGIEDLLEPSRLLERAASFIVILLPHAPYKFMEVSAAGKMASGTASLDYHRVIHRLLEPISYHLEERGIKSRIIVDTSPLSDRAIAVRAGLGVIRRNNMFYHKVYGSYVHIGALLTDYAFHDRDVGKINDPCGRCERCVVACPGNAILGDGTINSNLCVSYLTQKKELSEQESNIIGSWIYGCDVCQQVCPANRMARTREVDPVVGPDVDLKELLYMSNRRFSETYQQTASGWRGKRTLQRNALAVLGNRSEQSAVSLIENFLNDQRPIIRDEAERALKKLRKH